MSSSQISHTDRAFHYGDGLFETIAVYKGKPLLWETHWQRLQRGCQQLKLPEPCPIILHQQAIVHTRQQQKAVLKLIYSRGSGGRGYMPPQNPEPQTYWLQYPFPDYSKSLFKNGATLRWCDLQLAKQPLLAGCKHLNRLENVLARQEWQDSNIFDGLLCDSDDNVIEGTMSNLFWRVGDTWHTTDVSQCGVAGVLREQLLNTMPQLGISLKIGHYVANTVQQADEMFICNCIMGIVPVTQLAAQSYRIGDTTKHLQQFAYQHDWAVPHV